MKYLIRLFIRPKKCIVKNSWQNNIYQLNKKAVDKL